MRRRFLGECGWSSIGILAADDTMLGVGAPFDATRCRSGGSIRLV